MDSSKIVFLINDQVRLIKVSYEPHQHSMPGQTPPEGVTNGYLFKTLDTTIQVDDFVVVETGTRHGMTVCKVLEVDLDVDFDDGQPLKWAYHRVDLELIREIREQEAEAIAAAKRAELKRKRNELRAGIFAEHSEMIAGLALATPSLPAE